MKPLLRPYRIAFVLVLFMALLSSCSLVSSEKEATSTPKSLPTATFLPTRTPRPTLTPLPLATDTPLPIDTPVVVATLPPTPDLTAEAGAQATQAAAGMVDKINTELQKYGYSTSQGYLGWSQTEPISLKMASYQEQQFFTVGDDQVFKDFVFQADVTWESTGGYVLCGMFLRAEPDLKRGAQYRFQIIRLSGYPSWDIELFNYGQFQTNISGIQSSQSLDQSNGGTNTMTIIVENEQFTPIVNGEEFKTRTSSKQTEGLLGFYAWQDSGKTTCTYENAWIWVLE